VEITIATILLIVAILSVIWILFIRKAEDLSDILTSTSVPPAKRFLSSSGLEWATVCYALAFLTFVLAMLLPTSWIVAGYAVSFTLLLMATMLFLSYIASRRSGS